MGYPLIPKIDIHLTDVGVAISRIEFRVGATLFVEQKTIKDCTWQEPIRNNVLPRLPSVTCYLHNGQCPHFNLPGRILKLSTVVCRFPARVL